MRGPCWCALLGVCAGHICTGTGLTPATSAPGLGSPLPTSAVGLGSQLCVTRTRATAGRSVGARGCAAVPRGRLVARAAAGLGDGRHGAVSCAAAADGRAARAQPVRVDAFTCACAHMRALGAPTRAAGCVGVRICASVCTRAADASAGRCHAEAALQPAALCCAVLNWHGLFRVRTLAHVLQSLPKPPCAVTIARSVIGGYTPIAVRSPASAHCTA